MNIFVSQNSVKLVDLVMADPFIAWIICTLGDIARDAKVVRRFTEDIMLKSLIQAFAPFGYV